MKTLDKVTEIGGTSPTNDASSSIAMQVPYRVLVEIQGVCPILFHRWSNEDVEIRTGGPKGSKIKKTDNIESYLYRDKKGDISVPGEYLRMAVCNTSKFEQDPRSPRKSMYDLMKAALVSLTEFASTGCKDPDYIDRRRVVIQRNAITRSRPALKEGWKASFFLMVNLPEYVDPAKLNYLIAMAGRINGLGDFRPSYGRFNVTRFELMDN